MNRIAKLRAQMGISMKEAAAKLKMPYTTYVNYEKGTREPNSETLIKLASFFGTSIDYLLGKSEISEIPPGFSPLPELERVPLVGRIACGQPITAEENLEGYVSIPAAWHATFTLTCAGDSMEPSIHDGDLVAIRKDIQVENGQIAAVRIGDEATLKHVYLHSDYIELRPENPSYPSIIRRKEEMNDVTIEGKAVGLCRGL